MRCWRVEVLIDRYVDGRLSPLLMARTRSHIERCARCRALEASASALASALIPEVVQAPKGFSGRVMQQVYRAERVEPRRRTPSNDAGRLYRRLGYSFVATAAILSASLLVPRLAYPNLIRPDALAAELAVGRPAAIARIIDDAGTGLRDAIGPTSAGSGEEGGFSR